MVRKIYLIMLVLCSATGFAMEKVEGFIIKVVNETENSYYLKIPEQWIGLEDCEKSSDEFQRWDIEPEYTQYVLLQIPENSKCSALVEIKSYSNKKDRIKKGICRYKKKANDESEDEPPTPAFGRMIIYKDPSIERSTIYLYSKFEPNFRYETKKPIDDITLLIKQKKSGVSLLRLYKE